ncbi:MAG: hypothetical protein CL858_33150 [Cupriavidus sp.]|nr:hypothetical protein [Cupriavidus sp.]
MLGLAVVGALVGLAGRLLHPAGRVVTLPAALWLGALGAWAFFYAGRAAHFFTDGQLFGWGAAIVGAALFVAAWGLLRPRR